MKKYYERKVIEEKKNKMLVINAVRNKLVLRIFTCLPKPGVYTGLYMGCCIILKKGNS